MSFYKWSRGREGGRVLTNDTSGDEGHCTVGEGSEGKGHCTTGEGSKVEGQHFRPKELTKKSVSMW